MHLTLQLQALQEHVDELQAKVSSPRTPVHQGFPEPASAASPPAAKQLAHESSSNGFVRQNQTLDVRKESASTCFQRAGSDSDVESGVTIETCDSKKKNNDQSHGPDEVASNPSAVDIRLHRFREALSLATDATTQPATPTHQPASQSQKRRSASGEGTLLHAASGEGTLLHAAEAACSTVRPSGGEIDVNEDERRKRAAEKLAAYVRQERQTLVSGSVLGELSEIAQCGIESRGTVGGCNGDLRRELGDRLESPQQDGTQVRSRGRGRTRDERLRGQALELLAGVLCLQGVCLIILGIANAAR